MYAKITKKWEVGLQTSAIDNGQWNTFNGIHSNGKDRTKKGIEKAQHWNET